MIVRLVCVHVQQKNALPCVLTIASHLAVSMLYVTAMMGTVGRSLDTRSAVLPLVVNAIMALDLEISATYRAA